MYFNKTVRKVWCGECGEEKPMGNLNGYGQCTDCYRKQQNAKTKDIRISEAIEQFPEEFGLIGFPGKRFRFSFMESYINDSNDVCLYTVTQDERGNWVSFAKGSVAEFKDQVTVVKK